MEFFHHSVNIDWMGKAKYFVGMSLALLLIGAASWIHKGGLDYSVDFKGGTLVYVRFAGVPPVEQLRKGLTQQGLGDSVIQQTSDIANPNSNEVLIYLQERGQGAQAIDTGKTEILNALHATLGSGEAGKQDFNTVDTGTLAETLVRKDPLSVGAAAGNRYAQLAKQLTDYRDLQSRGVVANLDDLRQAGATPAVLSALHDTMYASSFAVVNVEIVGPK